MKSPSDKIGNGTFSFDNKKPLPATYEHHLPGPGLPLLSITLCSGSRARASSRPFVNVSAPTFFLHASSEALLQPAVPALVPLVFVYHTLSAEPGRRREIKHGATRLASALHSLRAPQTQSQTSLSYSLPEPREEPKVCKKRIESTLAWPSSSSSPPPFLPAGSAAISDHPPCEDCDGSGCESVTVT